MPLFLWLLCLAAVPGPAPTDTIRLVADRPAAAGVGLLGRGAPFDTIPDPDTIPIPDPDTIPAPDPDTIQGPDTIPEPGDLPEGEDPDSAADSVIVRNLPAISRPVPAGWQTGVWEWDREGLLATRAVTLLELLESVPGVIALRGGDYGAPSTVTAPGLGPGRIRVFLDGAELAPLDGGVLDLSRVGLVGLDRVRVLRRPGELRVELLGLQSSDPRPMSLLEVGTGDLQTNLFRGTFLHPAALGGNVLVALDRVDTEGPLREESGASYGAQLRHTLLRGDRGGVAWEFRRMTSQRPDELYEPEEVVRTDWNLKARWEPGGGATADVFIHRSSLEAGGEPDPGTEPAPDTLISDEVRSQVGLRAHVDRGGWWAEGELRRQGGSGWPDWVQSLDGGVLVPGWGGASGEVERQSWGEQSGTTVHGRLWTAPVLGVSLYAEAETGRRAVPRYVAPPPAEPDDDGGEPGEGEEEPDDPDSDGDTGPRFTELTGFRAGAELRRDDLFLGVAALSVDPDSLLPMGLPFDREGLAVPGGPRSGVEAAARLPLDRVLQGLALEGEAQFWSQAPEWRYAPRRSYQAQVRFHDVFLDTRNLEVWSEIGVRGRDGMPVPFADEAQEPARVPFGQSWYARLQIRVVSVRVFVLWENFTLRDSNQDLPGRILPQTRAMYGVRWTLWN